MKTDESSKSRDLCPPFFCTTESRDIGRFVGPQRIVSPNWSGAVHRLTAVALHAKTHYTHRACERSSRSPWRLRRWRSKQAAGLTLTSTRLCVGPAQAVPLDQLELTARAPAPRHLRPACLPVTCALSAAPSPASPSPRLASARPRCWGSLPDSAARPAVRRAHNRDTSCRFAGSCSRVSQFCCVNFLSVNLALLRAPHNPVPRPQFSRVPPGIYMHSIRTYSRTRQRSTW